jgi:hypothetical protein
LAAYPWEKLGCIKGDDGEREKEGKVLIIADVN